MKKEFPPPKKHITNCAGQWRENDIIMDCAYNVMKITEITHFMLKAKSVKNGSEYCINISEKKEYINITEMKRSLGCK